MLDPPNSRALDAKTNIEPLGDPKRDRDFPHDRNNDHTPHT
jgi:hypothetical protein